MAEEGILQDSLAPSPTEAAPGDSLIAQFYSFPVAIHPLPRYEDVTVQLYVRPEASREVVSNWPWHFSAISGPIFKVFASLPLRISRPIWFWSLLTDWLSSRKLGSSRSSLPDVRTQIGRCSRVVCGAMEVSTGNVHFHFSVLVVFPFLTRKQYLFRPRGTLVDANIKVNRYTHHRKALVFLSSFLPLIFNFEQFLSEKCLFEILAFFGPKKHKSALWS